MQAAAQPASILEWQPGTSSGHWESNPSWPPAFTRPLPSSAPFDDDPYGHLKSGQSDMHLPGPSNGRARQPVARPDRSGSISPLE